MKTSKLALITLFTAVLFVQAYAEKAPNMREVRQLAKLSTDEILSQANIASIEIESYWKHVHGRSQPLVVFFYSNNHGASQRVATLLRYIAPNYRDRLAFAAVKVADKGKPNSQTAKKLQAGYSLDDTPGILFYDNVGSDMVLEHEDYIEADFKEFRSPQMLLWSTYYAAVRKELDKLLSD